MSWLNLLLGPRAALPPPPTPADKLRPSALFNATMGSGWDGDEPETVERVAGAPQAHLTAFDPNWLTVFSNQKIGYYARAAGGIDRVEFILEGGEPVVVREQTAETWTDVLGVEHTDTLYWAEVDHDAIMALGLSAPKCALRVIAYPNNPAIAPRVSKRKIIYPRATEFAREVGVALSPGHEHPTLGAADFSTISAALQDAYNNRPARTRIWLLESGEYALERPTSVWDTAEEWLTIQSAPGVDAVIGGGLEGGTPTQVRVDALHFKGNVGHQILIDRARLGYTGASAFTLRAQSEGRLALEGYKLICSQFGGAAVEGITYEGTGVGKRALINGYQPSNSWVWSDPAAYDNGKLNLFFMEGSADENGFPGDGYTRYFLARNVDGGDTSGSTFVCSADHSLTWRCSNACAGGYTADLRIDNPAYTITYTGAAIAQVAAAGGNGQITRIDLIEDGAVAYSYTVRVTTKQRNWKVADFVAWVNDSKPGWAAVADERICPLSIEYMSRASLDPAAPFGTVTLTSGVPLEVTCKIDIHANVFVATRTGGVTNFGVFGTSGKMIGAAPFSTGASQRFDSIIENSDFTDLGSTYVNGISGEDQAIGAQPGYGKAIDDEHFILRCVTLPTSGFYYGTGYESLGYNVVDRVIAQDVSSNYVDALTGPGVGREHSNCVGLTQTTSWFVDDLAAINSAGYGTGIPGQSTVVVADVFVDALNGDLRPKPGGPAMLSDGTYAGRYNAAGEEQWQLES